MNKTPTNWKCKTLFILGICAAFNLSAATIEYNIPLQLDNSQIRSNAWSTSLQVLPLTTLNLNDTIRVNIDFASNERLRWNDTGAAAEIVGFTFWSQPTKQLNINNDVFISFHNPSGDYITNEFQGASNSSGAGIGGSTWSLGHSNLTDSYFDITGLTVELSGLAYRGPSETGLPANFERMSLSFNGGQFSIQPVPLPPAVLLFLVGVIPLLGFGRYAKKATNLKTALTM